MPLTARTLDFWDDQNLMEESDSEDIPFLLLSLKVTGEAEWMERYLEKPSRWWRFKGRSQPLFQEILAAFPKKVKGDLAHNAKIVLPIEVRGKKILVLNDRRSPVFAFREGEPNFENLEWFLEELKKDISSKDPRGSAKRASPKSSALDQEEAEIIEESLQNLKSHANCSQAWWTPSRLSLKVKTKDHRQQTFYVKNLVKKRKKAQELQDESSWSSVRDVFFQVCGDAVSFMGQKSSGSSGAAVDPLASQTEKEVADEEESSGNSEDDEDLAEDHEDLAGKIS